MKRILSSTVHIFAMYIISFASCSVASNPTTNMFSNSFFIFMYLYILFYKCYHLIFYN